MDKVQRNRSAKRHTPWPDELLDFLFASTARIGLVSVFAMRRFASVRVWIWPPGGTGASGGWHLTRGELKSPTRGRGGPVRLLGLLRWRSGYRTPTPRSRQPVSPEGQAGLRMGLRGEHRFRLGGALWDSGQAPRLRLRWMGFRRCLWDSCQALRLRLREPWARA